MSTTEDQEYFSALRYVREEPIVDVLIQLVDAIIPEVRSEQTAVAVAHLQSLRKLLADPRFRDLCDLENLHNEFMQNMVLKKQNYEFALQVAELTDNQERARYIRELLSRMDGFFAAGIEDLDPVPLRPEKRR